MRLPGILEERVDVRRAPVADAELYAFVVTAEHQIRWVSEIEALLDLGYRSRQVGEQVPRQGLVVAGQTGNGDVVDTLHRHSAGTEGGDRSHIAVVRPNGTAAAHFTAELKRVCAFSPTERVPNGEIGAVGTAAVTLSRIPVEEVSLKQRRSYLCWSAVVLGKQHVGFFPQFAMFYLLFLWSESSWPPQAERRPAEFVFGLPSDSEFIHQSRGQRGDK